MPGPLVTLDEAEVRVGAFVPPTRVDRAWTLGRVPLTGPVFASAAERLRQRGLGSDRPWVQEQLPGTVCPEGDWRVFVDHAEQYAGRPLTVVVSRPDGTDEITRLIPGRHEGRPVVSAELLVVPRDAGDDPLPVAIRLADPRDLTGQLVTAAYAVEGARLRVLHAGGVEDVAVEGGVGRIEVPRRFGKSGSTTVTADQVVTTLDRLLDEAFGLVSR